MASLHAVVAAFACQDLTTEKRSCTWCDAEDAADEDDEDEDHEGNATGTRCETELGPLVGLIGGPSCKDFSRANTKPAEKRVPDVYSQQSSPGRSAECMHGIVALAQSDSCPDWMIVENSDDLANKQKHAGTLFAFRKDLHECGFWTEVLTANATGYMLPQSRDRCFIVAIRDPSRTRRLRLRCGIASVPAALAKIVESMQVNCTVGPPDLLDLLYPAGHPRLQSELKRRQAAGPPKDDITKKELDALRHKWPEEIGRWIPQPEGSNEYPLTNAADTASPWYSSLSARKKGSLQYHQELCRKRMKLAKRKQKSVSQGCFTGKPLTASEKLRLEIAQDSNAICQLAN